MYTARAFSVFTKHIVYCFRTSMPLVIFWRLSWWRCSAQSNAFTFILLFNHMVTVPIFQLRLFTIVTKRRCTNRSQDIIKPCCNEQHYIKVHILCLLLLKLLALVALIKQHCSFIQNVFQSWDNAHATLSVGLRVFQGGAHPLIEKNVFAPGQDQLNHFHSLASGLSSCLSSDTST